MALSKYLQPRKYYDFAKAKWMRAKYTEYTTLAQERERQSKRFAAIGLDFEEAWTHLDEVLGGMRLPPYDESDSMASQHWLLFSAIALETPVENLLEIGTFDGRTTRLLSKLFPRAKIVTVDLEDESPHFVQSYRRDSQQQRAKHIATRTANLKGCRNVQFIPSNSFQLPKYLGEQKFDLIWVDGCHEYPAVAWDLFYAFHHIKPNGWLLADDFFSHDKSSWLKYDNDCKSLLDYLRIDGIIEPSYVRKRIQSTEFNRISDKDIMVYRR